MSEPGLCKFVASLAVEGLAANSIRIYLAGVRHPQIERGGQDPQWGSMPRLGQVLRGVRRSHAEARAGPQGCQEMQGRGRVQGQGEAPDVARHAVETEK